VAAGLAVPVILIGDPGRPRPACPAWTSTSTLAGRMAVDELAASATTASSLLGHPP
jgi:hypothetical protein